MRVAAVVAVVVEPSDRSTQDYSLDYIGTKTHFGAGLCWQYFHLDIMTVVGPACIEFEVVGPTCIDFEVVGVTHFEVVGFEVRTCQQALMRSAEIQE